MSIRWKDGHILWRDGHIAHSDDCCCEAYPECVCCGISPPYVIVHASGFSGMNSAVPATDNAVFNGDWICDFWAPPTTNCALAIGGGKSACPYLYPGCEGGGVPCMFISVAIHDVNGGSGTSGQRVFMQHTNAMGSTVFVTWVNSSGSNTLLCHELNAPLSLGGGTGDAGVGATVAIEAGT